MNRITVKELKELLKNVPEDYILAVGTPQFFLNCDDISILSDYKLIRFELPNHIKIKEIDE